METTEMGIEEEKSKYQKLMEDHPLLFARNKLSMQETCMCWGIEAGEGWYQPLRKLCDQLEAINLTIGKQFGLVIRAEQVKEKYGTLRVYYDIEISISWWRKLLVFPLNLITKLLRTDFTLEKTNIESDSDGKIKRYDIIWHPRFRYWLLCKVNHLILWIESYNRSDKKLEVVHGALMDIVNDLIDRTERECMNFCEECGLSIGTDWSPRCETQGWINYLCEKCAAKRNVMYAKQFPNAETRYFMGESDITEEYLKTINHKKTDVRKLNRTTIRKTPRKTTKKAIKNED